MLRLVARLFNNPLVVAFILSFMSSDTALSWRTAIELAISPVLTGASGCSMIRQSTRISNNNRQIRPVDLADINAPYAR